MSAKRRLGTAKLTFRTEPEVQRLLVETAELLGTDVNGALNLLVRQELPGFRDLAAKLMEANNPGQFEVGRLAAPTDEPLARGIVLRLHRVPRDERPERALELARERREVGDPPAERTAAYAVELLAKAEALQRVRHVLGRDLPGGPSGLGEAEERQWRRLEAQLEDELDAMRRRRQRDLEAARRDVAG